MGPRFESGYRLRKKNGGLLKDKSPFLTFIKLILSLMKIKAFFVITALTAVLNMAAQRHGVNPLGASDRATDQLLGNVESYSERVIAIDYSRRVVEEGAFIAASEHTYDEAGNILTEKTFDEMGMMLTKTIHQYTDGVKSVSTTYDSQDTRTLQTLYAFTADGVCARMRFTDAIGVTISTSEVSHKESWACNEETFADGENVKTEYFFSASLRLTKIRRESDSDGKRETIITLDTNGFPRRAVVKSKTGRDTLEYSYEYDKTGNWTRRQTSLNGVPHEIATRTYVYF